MWPTGLGCLWGAGFAGTCNAGDSDRGTAFWVLVRDSRPEDSGTSSWDSLWELPTSIASSELQLLPLASNIAATLSLSRILAVLDYRITKCPQGARTGWLPECNWCLQAPYFSTKYHVLNTQSIAMQRGIRSPSLQLQELALERRVKPKYP